MQCRRHSWRQQRERLLNCNMKIINLEVMGPCSHRQYNNIEEYHLFCMMCVISPHSDDLEESEQRYEDAKKELASTLAELNDI